MKYTTETFIKKAKEKFPNYDFSNTIYNGSTKTITAICDKEHTFTRIASQLLFGKGCPICGRLKSSKKRKNTEEKLIKKI